MPACRQASIRLLHASASCLFCCYWFDAPVAGHGRSRRSRSITAAQEIIALRDPDRPHAPDQGAAAARPGAVPARHRQPWLAPRRFPASEHGDTDVFRGIKLAPPARIHGRVAAASRLWADRRSLAGKLRIVQQPRLLSGRDDHGPGHPNSDRLFPWPTRGAARPSSPDRLVGGRLGIARSRQPKSARRVRGHQFRRRARGRASAKSATARRSAWSTRRPVMARPPAFPRSGSTRPTIRFSRLIWRARCPVLSFARAVGRNTLHCRPSAATGIGCSGLPTGVRCGSRRLKRSWKRSSIRIGIAGRSKGVAGGPAL